MPERIEVRAARENLFREESRHRSGPDSEYKLPQVGVPKRSSDPVNPMPRYFHDDSQETSTLNPGGAWSGACPDSELALRSLKFSSISRRPRFWLYEGFKIFTDEIGAVV